MHFNLTSSVVLLFSAQILAPARAPTTTSANNNAVTFHDIAQSQSAAQPAPSLREIAVELSGTVIGQMPNISIQFVLTLQNNGPQEVQILDPLDKFSLQFTRSTNKLIPLPRRVPKDLPQVALPKNALERGNRDAPYPAPIQFRQITSDTRVSYQKEKTVTIPAGARCRLSLIARRSSLTSLSKRFEMKRAKTRNPSEREQTWVCSAPLRSRAYMVGC
jgi:hypothetical protein